MTTDRKALLRAYKDAPRAPGIGRVRHVATGKSLLVVGRDLQGILNRHQAQLRMGAHANRALQDDWAGFGAEAFAFEILDTLSPSPSPGSDVRAELDVLLDLWLDKLAPFAPAGYHPSPAGRR